MLYTTIVIDKRTGKVRPEFSHENVSSGKEECVVGGFLNIDDSENDYAIHAEIHIVTIIKIDNCNPILIGTLG